MNIYIKKISKKIVLPTDSTKKVWLIIYYNKFKTSILIISNNTSPATELLDRTNIVYMFKCPLGGYVTKENRVYVGLNTTTLSRRLTVHLNDSSSIALHPKAHSIPESKFRKILVENTCIISLEIDTTTNPKSSTLKKKTTKLNRINFKNSDNGWNGFTIFLIFRIPWGSSIFLDSILF